MKIRDDERFSSASHWNVLCVQTVASGPPLIP